MKKIFLTLLVIISFKITQGQEVATTESGKKVILYTNGTYKAINESESKNANTSLLNTASGNTSNSIQTMVIQCSGFINKEERCKIMVRTKNGKCFQHK